MKAKLKILGSFAFLCFVIFTVTMSGCKKDKPAPEIPPEGTFVIQLSIMEGDTTKDLKSTYVNWWHSVLTVSVWDWILANNLSIPVSAFLNALDQDAIYNSQQDNWTWSYEYTAAGVSYSAELVATMDDEYVHWEMYISKGGLVPFNNVLWFYGDSKTDGTDGTWTIKRDAVNPVEYLGIVWHLNNDGSSDIRYNVIEESSPEFGSFIQYGISGDALYDVFYDVYYSGNQTSIEWHRTNFNGRVSDLAAFGDDQWHCWNYYLQDTDCP